MSGLVKRWRLKLGQGNECIDSRLLRWENEEAIDAIQSHISVAKCVLSEEVYRRLVNNISIVTIPPGGCVIAENRRIELTGVGNCGSVRTRQPTHANNTIAYIHPFSFDSTTFSIRHSAALIPQPCATFEHSAVACKLHKKSIG